MQHVRNRRLVNFRSASYNTIAGYRVTHKRCVKSEGWALRDTEREELVKWFERNVKAAQWADLQTWRLLTVYVT